MAGVVKAFARAGDTDLTDQWLREMAQAPHTLELSDWISAEGL